MRDLISYEEITQNIFIIRGQKVMLDSDVAELFGVETKQLNRQVKRNIQRSLRNLCSDLQGRKEVNWCQFGTSLIK